MLLWKFSLLPKLLSAIASLELNFLGDIHQQTMQTVSLFGANPLHQLSQKTCVPRLHISENCCTGETSTKQSECVRSGETNTSPLKVCALGEVELGGRGLMCSLGACSCYPLYTTCLIFGWSVFRQSASVCMDLEMFTEERCSCHVLCKLVLFSSVSHRLHVSWPLYKEQLNCYFEPFLLSVGSPHLRGYVNFCFRTKWTPQTGKLCQYLKGEARPE